MIEIHPTAIVDPAAELSEGCSVGPYSIIGPQVRLGPRCKVGPHVVIEGRTTFGEENTIFQFASIGAAPQDLKYRGEDSELIFGDKNIIRECVTIQPGTEGGGMLTRIGSQNLFMAYSHVGHDSHVGDSNIFANGVSISGHVQVEDGVTLGGHSAVHQFVRLGSYALLGGGSMVVQDIPPYCIAQGDHAKLVGINVIGLKRRGFSSEDIRAIRKSYRSLFLGAGLVPERITQTRKAFADHNRVEVLCSFVESTSRGIASARVKDGEDDNQEHS